MIYKLILNNINMNVRDSLNTEEGYAEIIEDALLTIKEWEQKILILQESEKNGIQKYPKPNLQVIESVEEDILNYQYKVLRASYSIGKTYDSFLPDYLDSINHTYRAWKETNGYVQMIWMLSIGIMLNIEVSQFNKLVDIVKRDNLNDYLIDFLIHYKKPDWSIKSQGLKDDKPYISIKEIIDLSITDKAKATKKLQKYLKSEWYKGHSDSGWHNTHKSKWNIHTGYWSFESGAIAKILKLDDSSLKDQPYYPYDMVHWKNK